MSLSSAHPDPALGYRSSDEQKSVSCGLHNRTDPLGEFLPAQQQLKIKDLGRLRVPADSTGITEREYRGIAL